MLRHTLAFLTAVALLGIADRVTAVAWAAVAGLLVMAAVGHPRAVLSLIASLGLLTLAFRAPAAMAGMLGLIGAASVVTGHILRSRSRTAATARIQPARDLLLPPAAH